MTISLMLFLLFFITAIQATIPYLLKKTIAFGVTIPQNKIDIPILATYKKFYLVVIGGLGTFLTIGFSIWAMINHRTEEKMMIYGLALQFTVLLFSMALYFVLHAKLTHLKQKEKWGQDLKEVRTVDIAIRAADEMLPSFIYLVPCLIPIGLIIYTIIQYPLLPDLIPTHWGIDGKPDAFTNKTVFSAISLPLILLVLQGMMLAINEFTKKSGIKINAVNKKRSRAQQLLFRKYTSWFLFITTLLSTILLSFLQLTIIHDHLGNATLRLTIPFGFLFILLLLTITYAVKVGQSGARLKINVTDEEMEGITNYDDDTFWKAGLFYVNKDDPSVFVEKRFGIGWTLNYGNPFGYLILFIPLVIIIVITLFL